MLLFTSPPPHQTILLSAYIELMSGEYQLYPSYSLRYIGNSSFFYHLSSFIFLSPRQCVSSSVLAEGGPSLPSRYGHPEEDPRVHRLPHHETLTTPPNYPHNNCMTSLTLYRAFSASMLVTFWATLLTIQLVVIIIIMTSCNICSNLYNYTPRLIYYKSSF